MEIYNRMRLAQDLAEALQSIEEHSVNRIEVSHAEIQIESSTTQYEYRWQLVNDSPRGFLLIAKRRENDTLRFSWPHGHTAFVKTGAETIPLMSTYSRTGSFEEKQPA